MTFIGGSPGTTPGAGGGLDLQIPSSPAMPPRRAYRIDGDVVVETRCGFPACLSTT